MGRGFFSGVLWGTAVSLVVLWTISQVSGIVSLLKTPADQVLTEAPKVTPAKPIGDETGDEAVQTGTQTAAPQTAAEPENTQLARNTPQMDQAQGEGVPATPEPSAGTAPRAETQTDEMAQQPTASVAMSEPKQPEISPEVSPEVSTVQPPAVQEPAPQPAPQITTGANSDAAPIAPPSPALPPQGISPQADTQPTAPVAGHADEAPVAPAVTSGPPSALRPAAAESGTPRADTAPKVPDFAHPEVVETPPLPPAGAKLPEADQGEIAALVPPVKTAPAPLAPAPGAAPAVSTADTAPQGEDAPQPAPAHPAPEQAVPQPQPDENAQAPQPQPGKQQANADAAPGQPVVRRFGETGASRQAGHFVRVGSGAQKPSEDALHVASQGLAPATPGGAPEADAENAPQTAPNAAPEPAADMPAIDRFAARFDNTENRPLLAVILLPGAEGETDALKLPFLVSFAVDASQAGATKRMREIREAGREVLLLAPLPAHASPGDVEQAFQAYLDAVPESVAAMDTPEAGFQGGRQVASQVAQILAAQGMGLVTYAKGLNSATQMAERDGVPAALVFRVIDDAGRNRPAIKRFLDQAAFRAGQKSGVILVAHDRPETIAALLEWSLGSRARKVALAPVSAALKAR